jgi:uncharacterized protein YjbJ (UPF0337 family)
LLSTTPSGEISADRPERHVRRNDRVFQWFSVRAITGEQAMDWNRVEGNWKQFKGNVKEKWGKLTDDDLDVIEGRRDQLEGKIQQRYGYAKDQARKDVDDWFNTLK